MQPIEQLAAETDSMTDLMRAIAERKHHVGVTGKQIGTESASTANNLSIIANILSSHLPRYTLEIGMATGISTILFAQHQRSLPELSVDAPPARHFAIDPFQSTVWDSVGIQNLCELGLRDHVELIEMYSCFALPSLLRSDTRFGFIYIDGSHLFEDVFVDFYYASRLLTDNGMVMLDDASDQHVKKVVSFVRSNLKSHFKEVGCDSCGYSSQLRRRVGRIIGRQQSVVFKKVGTGVRAWDAPFAVF